MLVALAVVLFALTLLLAFTTYAFGAALLGLVALFFGVKLLAGKRR